MANILTVFRLLLIPFIFILIKNASPLGLPLLAVAALTDFLDGYVARKQQQITELGQWLDPLTDRILIVVIVVALYLRDQFIPLPLVLLFLGRDFLIVTGAVFLKLQKKKIAVSFWGKLATFTLFFAILLLVAKQTKVGLIFLYIGLLFYLASGFNYFWQGKKLLEG